MKVKIGPYLNWWGPYQIVDAIFFWHEKYPSEELEARWDYKLHDRLSEWLSNSWVADVCQWIYDKRKRTVKIQLDRFDTWSMDHTLALIILPMLKQLKATKHGAGKVDDEDVPEHLRSTAPGAKDECKNEWDTDKYFFDRYDWCLEEMIWTFTQLTDDDSEKQFYDHSFVNRDSDINTQVHQLKVDREGLQKHWDRINNGLRLFGKYYRTLWD